LQKRKVLSLEEKEREEMTDDESGESMEPMEEVQRGRSHYAWPPRESVQCERRLMCDV